jgi:hypothetical protein
MSGRKHPLKVEIKRLSKTEARFAGITLFCAGIFFLLQWMHNEEEMMGTFKIIYKSGKELLAGNRIYGKAFAGGTETLQLSPFFVMCMVPLSLLTFKLAAAIYFMGLAGLFTWIVLFLRRMTKHYFGMGKEQKALVLFVFVMIFIDQFADQLQVGGVHLITLALLCLMFKYLVSRQYLQVGVIYAVLLLIYPHLLALVPLFLLRKRFMALGTAAVSVVVLAFLPIVFVGFNTLMGYLSDWKGAILSQHVDLLEQKNTMHYIISEFFFDPFGYEGTEALILFDVFVVAMGILAIVVTNIRLKRKYFSLMYFEVFLIVALIPNLIHGESGQFILSMPLVWLLLLSLFQKIEAKLVVITIGAIMMVPWLFTSSDFVGFKMKALIDEGGLLGLANLVFVGLAVYVFVVRRGMVVKKNQKSVWK